MKLGRESARANQSGQVAWRVTAEQRDLARPHFSAKPVCACEIRRGSIAYRKVGGIAPVNAPLGQRHPKWPIRRRPRRAYFRLAKSPDTIGLNEPSQRLDRKFPGCRVCLLSASRLRSLSDCARCNRAMMSGHSRLSWRPSAPACVERAYALP